MSTAGLSGTSRLAPADTHSNTGTRMTCTHDRTGRRNRLLPVSTGKRLTPTARDLAWFRLLAEHGALPSSFLLALSRDTHRSAKRACERLTDLFHEANTPDGAPYLARPPQQFRTLDSRYNQLVHDLTPAAVRALARTGTTTRTAAPGPWLHRLMAGCITASIELATREHDHLTYIAESEILARAGAVLRHAVTITDPTSRRRFEKSLIPDAIFGLRYRTDRGDRFRFFAVEADRATEPATSGNWNRKSFRRSLLQYEAYVSGGAYRTHLNLTAPLLVLIVSSDETRTARLIDLTARHYPSGNAFLLFQTWTDFGTVFRPPDPRPALLIGGWDRSGLEPFSIDML